MNDKSSSGTPLFFVTKSGMGYQEGVYTQEEIQSLPNAARPHIISLAVAESLGYVVLNHKSGNEINSLDIYAGIDLETGKLRKLRGVLEGTIDSPAVTTGEIPLTNKIGNALRDKLQDIKQKSTEEGLIAQIKAKKKELNNNKS
jgi:hypothetical protein